MDEGVTFGRGMPPVLLGGRVFVDGVGAGAAEDAGVGADEGARGAVRSWRVTVRRWW